MKNKRIEKKGQKRMDIIGMCIALSISVCSIIYTATKYENDKAKTRDYFITSISHLIKVTNLIILLSEGIVEYGKNPNGEEWFSMFNKILDNPKAIPIILSAMIGCWIFNLDIKFTGWKYKMIGVIWWIDVTLVSVSGLMIIFYLPILLLIGLCMLPGSYILCMIGIILEGCCEMIKYKRKIKLTMIKKVICFMMIMMIVFATSFIIFVIMFCILVWVEKYKIENIWNFNMWNVYSIKLEDINGTMLLMAGVYDIIATIVCVIMESMEIDEMEGILLNNMEV